jgi:hypothetical protein
MSYCASNWHLNVRAFHNCHKSWFGTRQCCVQNHRTVRKSHILLVCGQRVRIFHSNFWDRCNSARWCGHDRRKKCTISCDILQFRGQNHRTVCSVSLGQTFSFLPELLLSSCPLQARKQNWRYVSRSDSHIPCKYLGPRSCPSLLTLFCTVCIPLGDSSLFFFFVVVKKPSLIFKLCERTHFSNFFKI